MGIPKSVSFVSNKGGYMNHCGIPGSFKFLFILLEQLRIVAVCHTISKTQFLLDLRINNLVSKPILLLSICQFSKKNLQ